MGRARRPIPPHAPQPAVTGGCLRSEESREAATPCGGGRRHASSWPSSALCGGNVPVRSVLARQLRPFVFGGLRLSQTGAVQVARKRPSEDLIYLLALYHNLKPFGRGTVRKGADASEVGGDRPADRRLA